MRLLPDRGPWRSRAFRRVWSAQVVSAIGSRVTRTALPVIAVGALAASAREASLLGALAWGPGAVVGLVAGGWVDRRAKRWLLVMADLVRAALVVSVPIAYWLDALTLTHVCVVAGGVGAATALFAITDRSFLPELVSRDDLVDANGVSEATESVAEIAGPALAGGLIRAIGAPIAVLLDAVSYLWSAAFLGGIAPPEHPPPPPAAASVGADLRTGMSALWRDPIVRRLAVVEVLCMFGNGTFLALYMLYALRVLHLGAGTVGVVISMGGVGALLGALIAPRLTRGPYTLATLMAIESAAALLIPAAHGPRAMVLGFLVGHQLLGDGARTAYEVLAVSLRQRRLPAEVLGRANAAFHANMTLAVLFGALGAGELAELIGIRPTLWIGLGVSIVAPLPLLGLGDRDRQRA